MNAQQTDERAAEVARLVDVGRTAWNAQEEREPDLVGDALGSFDRCLEAAVVAVEQSAKREAVMDLLDVIEQGGRTAGWESFPWTFEAIAAGVRASYGVETA